VPAQPKRDANDTHEGDREEKQGTILGAGSGS